MNEKIVCAAVYCNDGVFHESDYGFSSGFVVGGHRHRNCHAIMFIANKSQYPLTDGFITSSGRFVDRIEARKIALKSGQITDDSFDPELLFSEDLY